jgi:hypothetical protein
VLGELATGWGIDGVAEFFGRCGSGLDVELLLTSGLADQVLHHVLGHGAAADVAVADKKDAFHVVVVLFCAKVRLCERKSKFIGVFPSESDFSAANGTFLRDFLLEIEDFVYLCHVETF